VCWNCFLQATFTLTMLNERRLRCFSEGFPIMQVKKGNPSKQPLKCNETVLLLVCYSQDPISAINEKQNKNSFLAKSKIFTLPCYFGNIGNLSFVWDENLSGLSCMNNLNEVFSSHTLKLTFILGADLCVKKPIEM